MNTLTNCRPLQAAQWRGGSDATQYLQNLPNDAILVLHFNVWKAILTPLAHKLHAELTDLKNGYKLVSDRSFGDQTVKLLKTTACRKAANEATLAAAGQKSYLILSSMMGGDPAKIFYEKIGSLFNPQSIIANAKEIDSITLQARIKALPFLCDVPVQ
ncbi:hypothetical protein PR048_018382 [Dryococelus australis]|uniref:Uncharacterized protein n=1 Tax=Dryococelus australis TaxID=614101 RepID=A0ABQ9HC48_9NEOP|nr:hypothetical protein PR048_018382 [Dryococelus australis]